MSDGNRFASPLLHNSLYMYIHSIMCLVPMYTSVSLFTTHYVCPSERQIDVLKTELEAKYIIR